jgi:hypothetical protein
MSTPPKSGSEPAHNPRKPGSKPGQKPGKPGSEPKDSTYTYVSPQGKTYTFGSNLQDEFCQFVYLMSQSSLVTETTNVESEFVKPDQKVGGGPVQKTVQKTVQKLDQKVGGGPVQKPVQKTAQKPVQKTAQKPAQKPVTEPVQNPDQKVGGGHPEKDLDFSRRNYIPFEIQDLADIYNALIAKKPSIGLSNFKRCFDKNLLGDFFRLSKTAESYPKIETTPLHNGTTIFVFSFTDIEGIDSHMEMELVQDGALFKVRSFNLSVCINGKFVTFTINVDRRFFPARPQLTGMQAIELFQSFLGDLVLIPYLNYFKDTGRVHSPEFNNLCIFEAFVRRVCRKNKIKVDMEAGTITVEKKRWLPRREYAVQLSDQSLEKDKFYRLFGYTGQR